MHASNLLTLFIISGFGMLNYWQKWHGLCMPWIFDGQVDTFSLIFREPPVKLIWTRVVSMNMSLIWILLCLGQPNYSFLPSDLSHMGSNQRLDLWIQWCIQDNYVFEKLKDSSNLCFQKLMDSSKFCIRKLMDPSKLCFQKLMDSSNSAFENWWTQANYAFENRRTFLFSEHLGFKVLKIWPLVGILWWPFNLVNPGV